MSTRSTRSRTAAAATPASSTSTSAASSSSTRSTGVASKPRAARGTKRKAAKEDDESDDETARKIANVVAMGIPNSPAATSLAMQAMMEVKLRYRMKNDKGEPISALWWILKEWRKILEEQQKNKPKESNLSTQQSNEKPSTSASSSASPSSPSSTTRPSCKYGSECYRQNPHHKSEEAHPGDADYSDNSAEDNKPASKKAKVDDSTSLDVDDYIDRLGKVIQVLESDPNKEPVEVLAIKEAGTAIPRKELNSILSRIPKKVQPHGVTKKDLKEEADAERDSMTPKQRREESKAMAIIRKKYAEAKANGTLPTQNMLTPDVLDAMRQNREKANGGNSN